MKLSFNLEDIKYLELCCVNNGSPETIKLAVKEKKEHEFLAVVPSMDVSGIEIPQKVSLNFICNDGLYKTNTVLKEAIPEGDTTCFVIENPDSLDYQQNREYFRILAEYDCIYTVDTADGIESYNAKTYDISAGGVSIILEQNILSIDDTSILIFFPERDLKSHLKFVRCESHEDGFKFSFEFTDLAERDYKMLSELCINKQLSSF